MRAAKVQARLRICAASPEPLLLAHTSSESRGTFRQKARSLTSLNGWACAVKTCHDGMLEDTNSLDRAHIIVDSTSESHKITYIILKRCFNRFCRHSFSKCYILTILSENLGLERLHIQILGYKCWKFTSRLEEKDLTQLGNV